MKKNISFSFLVRMAIISCYECFTAANNEVNNAIKEKIIEAGCPFVSATQLLERNVCLMPDYASNELPMDLESSTNVSLYLLSAHVIEVDESKNTLTVELLQYMEWSEPRIRANFSSSIKQNKIKLSTKSVNKIWHPDLDVYTKDLKEWKSLYDPMLYQDIYLSNGLSDDSIKLSALKSWKATIVCKFDFSFFPFDIQNCAFRQFGSSQNLHLISSCRKISTDTKYKLNDFDVSLAPAGKLCDSSKTLKDLSWIDTGFNVTLKRKIISYVYTYYLPSLAIVVVSQVSFIVPLSSIPGRIGLVVTQFLTLTNIFIHQMVMSKKLH
jgi:hypothetical protein